MLARIWCMGTLSLHVGTEHAASPFSHALCEHDADESPASVELTCHTT